MPSKNKEIVKKHRDAWYAKNKEKQITRQLERRRELSDWLRSYKKSLSCVECGMSFNEYPECLDFHHIDPTQKEGTIHMMVVSSKERMLKELTKCIPLCANCHRKTHARMLVEANETPNLVAVSSNLT